MSKVTQAKPRSVRLTDYDLALLEEEYGTLTAFIRVTVAKLKKKKGVAPKKLKKG